MTTLFHRLFMAALQYALLGLAGVLHSGCGSNVSFDAQAVTAVEGYPAIAMAALKDKVPAKLQAQWENIEQAAAQYNIQPQLLVAIAMAESTGGSDANAYANGGGMFQFTNDATWAHYGKGASRSDDAAEVFAAAHYMADNLLQCAAELHCALRLYNGPLDQGGNPNYQSTIQKFMLGEGF